MLKLIILFSLAHSVLRKVTLYRFAEDHRRVPVVCMFGRCVNTSCIFEDMRERGLECRLSISSYERVAPLNNLTMSLF